MAMRIERDGILLCMLCTQAAVNGDTSSLDYYYAPTEAAEMLARIVRGLDKLGPHLTLSEGSVELTNEPCACCGDKLADERQAFAILGEAHT
jgi:hypothetical protein